MHLGLQRRELTLDGRRVVVTSPRISTWLLFAARFRDLLEQQRAAFHEGASTVDELVAFWVQIPAAVVSSSESRDELLGRAVAVLSTCVEGPLHELLVRSDNGVQHLRAITAQLSAITDVAYLGTRLELEVFDAGKLENPGAEAQIPSGFEIDVVDVADKWGMRPHDVLEVTLEEFYRTRDVRIWVANNRPARKG